MSADLSHLGAELTGRNSVMLEPLPLSFQQQWLWTLLQRQTDWNCTLAAGIRLKGRVDIPVLRQSVSEVMRSHDTLRTRILTKDGIALQQVMEPTELILACERAHGTSETEIERSAARIFEEFSASRFDLAAGPPVKLKLLELSAHEHWLLLAIHRLLVDCSSTSHVFSFIWPIYSALLQGRPVTSPPVAQYSDYAVQQHQEKRAWTEKHEGYWQRRLDGARPLRWPGTGIATGKPRAALGRMSKHFGVELSNAVRNLARRTRSLPGTVMLAIYVSVLWDWCRQHDFILPFNVAGRQAGHRATIGFFSHILYLRMQLSGRESFSELVQLVSSEFYRALAHQDFGIAATCRPELLGGAFAQWVTWHPEAGPGLVGADLVVERLGVRDFDEDLTAIPPGMVDVEVSFFDARDGIHALGVYRADLFDATTMERFMADLHAATARFANEPQTDLGMLLSN